MLDLDVADEFVGAFDAAADNGIAVIAGTVVVKEVLICR